MAIRAETSEPVSSGLDADAAAATLETELRDRAVPFWTGTVDRRHGGFRLAARHGPEGVIRRTRRLTRAWRGPVSGTAPSPFDKHLVGQARVVFALALAARLGYDATGRARAAADQGARFLVDRLADTRHGGFIWCATRAGRPRAWDKLAYGQAMAMLALVEHHRASADPRWLEEAMRLFEVAQRAFADPTHGGWHERLTRDLQVPDPATDRPGGLTRVGWISHNTQLHVMEALAELAAATGDRAVRAALAAAIGCAGRFLPKPDRPAVGWLPAGRPGAHRTHTRAASSTGTCSSTRGCSCGHPMRSAPSRPGIRCSSRSRLRSRTASIGAAGVLKAGASAGPPTELTREWWAQAEALIALAVAWRRDARFAPPLARQLDWILRRHRTPSGAWLADVGADGRTTNPTLAGTWKAGYHEVRSLAFTAALLRRHAAPWR